MTSRVRSDAKVTFTVQVSVWRDEMREWWAEYCLDCERESYPAPDFEAWLAEKVQIFADEAMGDYTCASEIALLSVEGIAE